MENIKLNEDMKKKIISLIGFVDSIMENVDCDIEIDDDFTIADGWKSFVEPVINMIEE